jgi:CelD/BcsL family acetyltransferase involved in cellulose biosynthesis
MEAPLSEALNLPAPPAVPALAPAGVLRVQVARSVADLRQHAAAYEALLQRLPDGAGLFYTLPWLEILSAVYVTPQRAMHFLLAWRGSALVGVAPLQMERKSLSRGGVRRLFCWGNVHGSLMLEGGFLIPEADEVERCIAAFAAHALDPRDGAADFFEFHYLDEAAPAFGALQRRFRPQAGEPEDMPSYQIRLPERFEDYAPTVSTATLANSRNRWRALQKAGKVEFLPVQALAQDELEQVMQVHASRQSLLRERGRTRQSLFQDPVTRSAYLRLLAQTAKDGSARHYLIKADGRVIAFGLGFLYRGTYVFHLTGFDQAWSRFQPGRVLLFLMVQDAISRGDTRLIDMLPGITKVKQDFSNASRTYRSLSGTRTGSLLSRAKVRAWRLSVATAERLRHWRDRVLADAEPAAAEPAIAGVSEESEAGPPPQK